MAAKEQLVILIDTHPDMFNPVDGVEASSLADLCLRVCIDLMRSRVIESPKDEISILFYGTKTTKNRIKCENVFTFLEMESTSVERLKQICSVTDAKIKEEHGLETKKEDGLVYAESLKSALWESWDLLNNQLRTAKTILLFTCNPDPCAHSPQIKEQVLKRAKQISSFDIHLHVFLLPTETTKTETSFWKEFNDNTKQEEEVNDFEDDVMQRLEYLSDNVKKKVHQKRALASLTMTIIKNLECRVKVYALVNQAKKPTPVTVDDQTREVLTRSTALICKDTGARLSEISELCFQPEKTGEDRYPRLVVKAEDVGRAKTTDHPAGIKIIGFMDMAALKDYHQLRNALFVYPDEASLKGSTTTFMALHEAMLSSNSLAFCSFKMRQSSQIRNAALIAQQELQTPDGQQAAPPGLQLIPLPFSDEIRHPEWNPKIVGDNYQYATEEQEEAAGKLIDSLTLPEDFSTFDIPNPHLQRHYQAVALGAQIQDISSFVDESLPDLERLRRHSSMVMEFRRSIYGEDEEMVDIDSFKKRKVIEMPDDEVFGNTNWRELADKDELDSLPVNTLKSYLRVHSLKLSGNKAAIIERIKSHLRNCT